MHATPAVSVPAGTVEQEEEILRPEWANNVGYFIWCFILGVILTAGLIWAHEQAYTWFAQDPNKASTPALSSPGLVLTDCQKANGVFYAGCSGQAKPTPVPTPQVAVASSAEPSAPKVVPPDTARSIELIFRISVTGIWVMVIWMIFSQVMRTIYTSWEFLEDVLSYHYRTAGSFWQISRNPEYRWARVWDKDYEEGPIQRGFRVGDVWMLVRDASGTEVKIWGVKDPRGVYERISVLEASAKQRYAAETNIWGGQEPQWKRHKKQSE